MGKVKLFVVAAAFATGCTGQIRGAMRVHANNLDSAANDLNTQADACNKDPSTCSAAWAAVKVQAASIQSTSRQMMADAAGHK